MEKLGVGTHTLNCTRCGRRFRYRRAPKRPGRPRRACFRCLPDTGTGIFEELPVESLLAQRPELHGRTASYVERVADWLSFLRTSTRGRPSCPEGTACAPCDASRLLAVERAEGVVFHA